MLSVFILHRLSLGNLIQYIRFRLLPKYVWFPNGILNRFLSRKKFMISLTAKSSPPCIFPTLIIGDIVCLIILGGIMDNFVFSSTTLPPPLLCLSNLYLVTTFKSVPLLPLWLGPSYLSIPCKLPPYLHDQLSPSMLNSLNGMIILE